MTHTAKAILALLIAFVLIGYALTTPGDQIIAALIGGFSAGIAVDQFFRI